MGVKDISITAVFFRLFVIFQLAFTLTSCQSKTKEVPEIEKGLINLSDWDFEQKGIIQLDGEWDFFWGSLLTKTSEMETANYAGTCLLPKFWTEVASEETYFEQNGVATYHLKLILPDTLNEYSLKLNAVFTAYALWEEGSLLASVGKVGFTPEATHQNFMTKLVRLPKKRVLNLFLQVASWEHTRGGGTAESILLGRSADIHQVWLSNFIVQIMACAVILGIALYLIVLAFHYPENPSYLYIGLFAVLGAIRAICIDEMIIEDIFNDLPYYWNQRFRYVGFFAGIGFFVLSVNEFFKGYVSKYILYGAYTLFGYSILTFVWPFSWSSYLSPYFQMVALIVTGSCFYYMGKTIRDGKNVVEATLFMIGGLTTFFTMIHYLLYVADLVQGRLYHNFGYIVFIFSQIIILGYRSRTMFDKAQSLSNELSILNKNLENKVGKRVGEIEIQKNKISQQAAALSVANEKLTELDEAKNRFFANISHELRTPLTLILGGTSKIKKRLNVKNKGVELIEQQSNLLHQLINQLLDLTKSEAGKMELSPSSHPIITLFRDFLTAFQPLAAAKGITLEFSSNREECYAVVDHHVIGKIMYNLLSNAYKFTPASGSIALDVSVQDEYFQLTVEDSGIGIAADKLSMIFDKFYQAENSIDASYQGTGIGLALVKELVELHGGSIEVISTEGKGTCFSLIFPLKLAEKTSQQASFSIETTGISVPNELKGDHVVPVTSNLPVVLVVEDHPDLQTLIVEELPR